MRVFYATDAPRPPGVGKTTSVVYLYRQNRLKKQIVVQLKQTTFINTPVGVMDGWGFPEGHLLATSFTCIFSSFYQTRNRSQQFQFLYFLTYKVHKLPAHVYTSSQASD